MKTSKKELDVDFIGGLRPLTKEDEQAISEFLKRRKSISKKISVTRKSKKSKRVKVIA